MFQMQILLDFSPIKSDFFLQLCGECMCGKVAGRSKTRVECRQERCAVHEARNVALNKYFATLNLEHFKIY